MKKSIIVLFSLLLGMLPATAQVHNAPTYYQWRSMESGPVKFRPQSYYYIFHKAYSGIGYEWGWRGLKTGWFFEDDAHEPEAKVLVNKRLASEASTLVNNEQLDTEVENMKAYAEKEELLMADRLADLAYVTYKDDLNSLKSQITSALATYIAYKGVSAESGMKYTRLKGLFDSYKADIDHIHTAYMGNGERKKCYEVVKGKMVTLLKDIRMLNYNTKVINDYKKSFN